MKGTTFTVVLGALALAGGATALAQGKPETKKPEAAKPEAGKAEAGKPMGPPPVPKEMDQLKIFVGEWKCTGEAAGPASLKRARAKFTAGNGRFSPASARAATVPGRNRRPSCRPCARCKRCRDAASGACPSPG